MNKNKLFSTLIAAAFAAGLGLPALAADQSQGGTASNTPSASTEAAPKAEKTAPVKHHKKVAKHHRKHSSKSKKAAKKEAAAAPAGESGAPAK